MLRLITFSCLTGLATLGAVAAQQSAVVPIGHETQDASSQLHIPGFRSSLRQQILIDESELPPGMVGRALTHLWVRRDASQNRPLDGGEANLRIALSRSPRRSSAFAGEDMDANEGADRVVVFDGTVTTPASPPPSTTVAPWAVPDAIRIAFQLPYVYTGGTLVVDLLGAPAPGSTPTFWPVDGVVAGVQGQVVTWGQTCQPPIEARPMPGGVTHDVAKETLLIGNSISVKARGVPGSTAVLVLGSGLSAQPYNLGFLGSPTCDVHIDVATTSGILTVGPAINENVPQLGGFVWQRVYVPHHPSLLGAQVATQWFLMRPVPTLPNNPTIVQTTNAAFSTIARDEPPHGMATVEAPWDGARVPTHGSVDRSLAHVLRFDYQ